MYHMSVGLFSIYSRVIIDCDDFVTNTHVTHCKYKMGVLFVRPYKMFAELSMANNILFASYLALH